MVQGTGFKYVERGDAANAVASMGLDLRKHEAWTVAPWLDFLMTDGLILVARNDLSGIRRWIEGFN